MNERTHQEELLDAGIEESFPASDPVSVVCLPVREDHFPIGTAPATSARRAKRTFVLGSLGGALGTLAAAGALYHAASRAAQREREAGRRRIALYGAVPLLVVAVGTAFAALRPARETA